eukprot:Pompholyxophrys_punicea_v1_NODE_152_length_3178_cov_3.531540.p5 type:complete len:111 gc:universal NODE_152_length_3178_cov_3.531540:620-288(-)
MANRMAASMDEQTQQKFLFAFKRKPSLLVDIFKRKEIDIFTVFIFTFTEFFCRRNILIHFASNIVKCASFVIIRCVSPKIFGWFLKIKVVHHRDFWQVFWFISRRFLELC